MELNQTSIWNVEDPTQVFTNAFGMSQQSADSLLRNLPIEVLHAQTPAYWAREWIRKHEQHCSKGFMEFIESLEPGDAEEYSEENDVEREGNEDEKGDVKAGSDVDFTRAVIKNRHV